MSNSFEPTSKASRILTACEVDPLADCVENFSVEWIPGKLSMNADTLTALTARPSSALIFAALGSVAMRSRPSPAK